MHITGYCQILTKLELFSTDIRKIVKHQMSRASV